MSPVKNPYEELKDIKKFIACLDGFKLRKNERWSIMSGDIVINKKIWKDMKEALIPKEDVQKKCTCEDKQLEGNFTLDEIKRKVCGCCGGAL